MPDEKTSSISPAVERAAARRANFNLKNTLSDFVVWLSSRSETVTFGSSNPSVPSEPLITEYVAARGLDVTDPGLSPGKLDSEPVPTIDPQEPTPSETSPFGGETGGGTTGSGAPLPPSGDENDSDDEDVDEDDDGLDDESEIAQFLSQHHSKVVSKIKKTKNINRLEAWETAEQKSKAREVVLTAIADRLEELNQGV